MDKRSRLAQLHDELGGQDVPTVVFEGGGIARDGKELYARQEAFNLFYPAGVAVVGVGGVGSWVAILLGLSGVSPLYLFDGDHFDASNRNRVPITSEDIGKSKSQVIREFILKRRPDSTIVACGQADAFALSMFYFAVLVDCTDRLSIQQQLCKFAETTSHAYIRAGYNGEGHLTLADTVSNWGTPDYTEGYRTIPSWVVPALMVALFAVYKIMLRPEFNFTGEIGDIADPDEVKTLMNRLARLESKLKERKGAGKKSVE